MVRTHSKASFFEDHTDSHGLMNENVCHHQSTFIESDTIYVQSINIYEHANAISLSL